MSHWHMLLVLAIAQQVSSFSSSADPVGKTAAEIPRIRTPGPGPWPQDGVYGCGFPGLPVTTVLAECTEPLHPDAPDIRGYWKTPEGQIDEFIEQCGMRWLDTSPAVHHDHPVCDGTLEGGVEDYAGGNIISNNTECKSIRTSAKFEKDEDGHKCIVLYSYGGADPVSGEAIFTKAVSRCLKANGQMLWTRFLSGRGVKAGTTLFDPVPKDEEPNCMTCPDGSISKSPSEVLLCGHGERKWERCA